jgi:hypothetical protein
VNVDEPPESQDPSACKVDRYAEHRESGSCKACHDLMDPIGFGLENFDQQGRWREHDAGDPTCVVTGEGDLNGEPFVGPAGLADRLIAGGTLTDCAVVQAYRLAHAHDPGAEDAPYLERLTAAFGPTGRMDELLLALVSDEAFLYRREEPAAEVGR